MCKESRKTKDCFDSPFMYTYETTKTIQDGMKLFWYVLADEHEVEIHKFESENDAINFINECEIREVNVITVFYGRQLMLQRIESLCPAD